MNLIRITNGLQNWEFQIGELKYILGSIGDFYPLYQTIRLFCNKDKSEFREENGIQAKIMLDEADLNVKHNLFLEITDLYSLNEDRKMNSKSLMLKYVELRLQDYDLFDTINTIDLLFQSLSEEINESSVLKVVFDSIIGKQLIKLLTPYYADEYQKDEFDVSRKELISFQIGLINYIAMNHKKYDNVFVFARLHHLDECMVEELRLVKNCKLIVFTDQYVSPMFLEDICLMQQTLIDFADMDVFYRGFMEQAYQFYTKEELITMVINYLMDRYTRVDTDIYRELEHFSNK